MANSTQQKVILVDWDACFKKLIGEGGYQINQKPRFDIIESYLLRSNLCVPIFLVSREESENDVYHERRIDNSLNGEHSRACLLGEGNSDRYHNTGIE